MLKLLSGRAWRSTTFPAAAVALPARRIHQSCWGRWGAAALAAASTRRQPSYGVFGALAARAFSTEPVQKKDKPYQITTTESKLKHLPPVSNGQRFTAMIDKRNLWRGRPIKALTEGIRKKGGRNNQGRITARHRGGGNKRRYRFIDFKRQVLDQPATVQRFEYDPNRSAFIALVAYQDGTVSYILAPQGVEVGEQIESSRTRELDIKPGNAMPLKNIPIGQPFHNLEIQPGRGAQMARSAGTSCVMIDKGTKPGYGLVNICSKEQRYVKLDCMATIGVVSNEQWHLQNLGKAGRNRWLGKRPHVRGVAMNPVDHPMGGGEGRSSGGRHSCSPKGILAKGFKTVKKTRNRLVVLKRGGKLKAKHY